VLSTLSHIESWLKVIMVIRAAPIPSGMIAAIRRTDCPPMKGLQCGTTSPEGKTRPRARSSVWVVRVQCVLCPEVETQHNCPVCWLRREPVQNVIDVVGGRFRSRKFVEHPLVYCGPESVACNVGGSCEEPSNNRAELVLLLATLR
jgi:hypothetical protein